MIYKKSIQCAAFAATLTAVPFTAFADVQVPAIEASASAASAAQAGVMAPVDTGAAARALSGSRSPTETTAVPTTMPPPIDPLAPDRIKLDEKEQHGLRLSRSWRYRREMPAPGRDGYIRYLFGATLPTVVCSPLRVCDLTLQPGEVVTDQNIGDSVQWYVAPSISGSGPTQTTHIIIKPTNAGLETSLNLITNRRTYVVKLVSTRTEWMPLVGFIYPDEADSKWSAYRQTVALNSAAYNTEGAGNPANLQFMCIMPASSGPGWSPIRAYTDGSKTYIQFPHTLQHQAAPALVALGNDGTWFSSPTQQMVNYRAIGDRYVVDAVLDKAALIAGVGGDQQRVTITRAKDCQ